SEIISIPDKLIVPHPEMHKRKFVLVPLAEIAGQFIHPVAKRSVEDILLELNDPLEVRRV
ncbi:MAG: 2-amino-4-hydroxy-6-hydroxymethyldihydropteridine diphosphokinase, partial [Sphingobacteriales bacterium]